MHIPCRSFSFTIRLISLILLLVNVTAGAVPRSFARIKPQLMRFAAALNARAAESSNSENHGSYVWNIDDGHLPCSPCLNIWPLPPLRDEGRPFDAVLPSDSRKLRPEFPGNVRTKSYWPYTAKINRPFTTGP